MWIFLLIFEVLPWQQGTVMTLTLIEGSQAWFQRYMILLGLCRITFHPLKGMPDKGKKYSWACAIILNALILYLFQTAFSVLPSEILERHFQNQFKLVAHVLHSNPLWLICTVR